MRIPFLALVAMLSICMPAAHAREAHKGKAVPRIDCANASATPELNHCAEIRLKKADSDLSAAVEKARAQVGKRAGSDAGERGKWIAGLEDAQKAWAAYREADCKGVVPYEWQGGTGATLAVLECMAQMTEARAFELTERYAEGR